MRRLRVLLIMISVAGCGPSGDSAPVSLDLTFPGDEVVEPDAEAPRDTRAPDTEASRDTREVEVLPPDTRDGDDCHVDCLMHEYSCEDGVVTHYFAVAVSCEAWTGECPSEQAAICEKGCARAHSIGYLDPTWMCVEGRPKQVGDPCEAPEDCEPQIATVTADGEVENVYLRCDAELGECVAREPPTVEGWLEPCGIESPFGPSAEAHEFGYLETAACPEGLCLFTELSSCVLQGCTIACESDAECPLGATCAETLHNWSESPAYRGAVCKPGHPNRVDAGLACPPDTR